MIKAIITDLDGTLLPRGGSISADTLEAFRLAGIKDVSGSLQQAVTCIPPSKYYLPVFR